GDDITAQVRASGAVPERIAAGKAGSLEVRGELYLPRAAVDALKRQRVAAGGGSDAPTRRRGAAGDKPLVNPRNGCAGMMKRKDAGEVAGKGVRAFLYSVAWHEGLKLPSRHVERL